MREQLGQSHRVNETHVFRSYSLVRRVTHRTCFRVVVGAFRVEIDEILRRVFSNTKFANGNTSLGVEFLTNRISLLCILILVRVFLVARAKVTIPAPATDLGHLPHGSQVRRRLIINLILPFLLPHLLNSLILIINLLVVARIVPIPPIPFRIIPHSDVMNNLIRHDILPRKLGASFPRSFEAVESLVGHGTAVRTGAFAEFGGGWAGFLAAFVPVVEFYGGFVFFWFPLVVQRR